jgi:hypothetical protein
MGLIKKAASFTKSGFVVKTTKPQAFRGLRLVSFVLFPKDTERQTP